jgi:O-antigen/teichoic acid export membrane protein
LASISEGAGDPALSGVASPAPLGGAAARGAISTIAYSLVNKLVAFGSQIAIAWYLTPSDIGLVATATSVVGLLSFMLGGQLQNVLIQRQSTFARDAGQVFWLSLGMNCFAAFAVAAAAGRIAAAFDQPGLKLLLLLIAATIPILAIPVAYAAKLLIDLRFQFLNACFLGQGVITNAGAAMLAACGFGARSMVIPLGATALFAACAQRLGAGRIRLGRPRPKEWPALLAPAFWLMANALFGSLSIYATNLVVAARRGSEVTGLFFWGVSISAQAAFLLVTNLRGVFFPIFSRISRDTDRQRDVFERVLGLAVLVCLLLCLLQALLAKPIIQLLFHPRWTPASPVVAWLSAGIVTQPFSVLGGAVLMSRGHYTVLAKVAGITAAVTLFAAWIGARIGGEREIALCVGLATLLTNLLPGVAAYRLLNGRCARLLRICRSPAAVALAGSSFVIPVALLARHLGPALQVLATSAAAAVSFVPLTRWLAPDAHRAASHLLSACRAASGAQAY